MSDALSGLSAEETIEAIRRGAEGCERSLDRPTERDLVRALVGALPVCWRCQEPATKGSSERPSTFCDAHVPREYEAIGGTSVSWRDLPYAPALRALRELMVVWDVPMPGAGAKLLANTEEKR